MSWNAEMRRSVEPSCSRAKNSIIRLDAGTTRSHIICFFLDSSDLAAFELEAVVRAHELDRGSTRGLVSRLKATRARLAMKGGHRNV